MSNPATLLADLLDQWRVPNGQSIANVRREWAASNDDKEFWKIQRTAVRYLQEIDDALASMEAQTNKDMSFYRSQMSAWHSMVFGVQHGWEGGVSGGYEVDGAALNLLQALGHMLDATNYAPDLTPDALQDLLETIRESRDLVVEAQFPDTLATHLLGLLREAEDAVVDFNMSGTVKIRSAAEKASGAMIMASADETIANDPGKISKFRQVAGHIMLTVAVSSGTNVTTDAMQELFHIAPPLAIEAPAQRQLEPPQLEQVEVQSQDDVPPAVGPEDD
jgi:hypothetical protein